ncbi:MAG: carboxypeptidase-like regulatory domain-containing protein [Bacteroidales bacterium]|nr:carboxypeptidase-like regulatory domain-containing protein [Bacteroidales bacterium]
MGKVTDAETGEELIGAAIIIKGTTKGTITDFDGNYILDNVSSGKQIILCSYISYETEEVEVEIADDKTVNVSFELRSSEVSLEEVQIIGRKNRESENLLLIEQKKAAVAVESIGARELSAKGASDAVDAATKITGITKQEGTKTLNIRGLGDRYNSTTLNGLPIPSNNAETKNIDLKIFTTDIIEYISVEKIFTANLYADFAGANVNISSRQFTGRPFLNIDLKTGTNTGVFDAAQFYLQDGPGFWGFNDFEPTYSLQRYSFETNWNPVERNSAPNLGFGISGGRSFAFPGSKLNAFYTLSYDNEYSYSDYMERRVNGSNRIRKDLEGEQYNFETQTTGMINLNLDMRKHNLYYNFALLNSSDQELKNLNGFIQDLAETGGLVRRSDFERTTLIINQLLGRHDFNKNILKWGISYNNVTNKIPDRRHLTLSNIHNGVENETFKHFTNDNESDYFRYFHELTENEYAANISLEKSFGQGSGENNASGQLTFGYTGKYKKRNFEATQFNHDIYHQARKDSFFMNQDYYWVYVNIWDIDAFLNDENLQNNEFYIRTFFGNTIRPQTYIGTQIINGVYGLLEYSIAPRLLATFGSRFEYVYQSVEYVTSENPIGGNGDFSELNILPGFSLKYIINDKNNLRLAASKTYVLPQFTEMALFLFEGITETSVGNPRIYLSKVYNLDLKWEMFPGPGELFSATPFGKYIIDPMNKFVMTGAANDFTYANTGDWAYIYGAELEAKKDIFNFKTTNGTGKLFGSANFTLMKTLQELDEEKIATETVTSDGYVINANFNTKTDVLQGAAPLIANAAFGYSSDWNERRNSFTSTIVYNYVSDRVYLIGANSFGNQVDKEVHTVDLIIKARFSNLGIGLSAKNLLDPDIQRIQENETRSLLVRSYKRGIKFSFDISCKF